MGLLVKPSQVFAGLTMFCIIQTGVAYADPLDHAAVDAPPQRYVMTLPQAPVGEVAEEVLGQTLGLPVTTDERVDARMTFRVDGVYSPKELAREFGYQLWNVDVVLIEDKAHELKLIPARALPEAILQGAEVIAPLAITPPIRANIPAGLPRRRISYGDRRWHENDWWRALALICALLLGWVGGLFTPRVGAWAKARRTASSEALPRLWLSAAERALADDDFSIPDKNVAKSNEKI